MIILGIDPGMSGALASWDGTFLQVLDIPTVKSTGRGREVVWAELNQKWDEYFIWADHGFLERVHSRPGEGVSSAFKFGTVFGGLRAMTVAKRVPLSLVTPQAWKKAMGVAQGSKQAAVVRATELFPEYAKHFVGPKGGKKDGVADAALISLYGHRKLLGVDG